MEYFPPSSSATEFGKKRYKRAKQFWFNKGVKIKERNVTGKSDFYRSGTIKEKSLKQNNLIYDSEVRCIMASIGGVNLNSLLPYIDYND
ncbi:microcin immunity protein [Streptococcus pseudoporcinus]|uniref:Microcin immunity protein n=1 Tax=Streptococcus pseudoporcinus TaxID=361101 RepID=A0A4U9XHB3_9STRE|nr:microcin immunity protein [Streptococcus pseudoporcinus]VUC64987.1 microcin immunity protein [Streptococcus pseudoporcinus]VUC95661.1 microcin immunity protein [Streptococcus pseudoporcinus]VUC96055.1 microcin immunity protein [Streptococcus pseudoporcinus]